MSGLLQGDKLGQMDSHVRLFAGLQVRTDGQSCQAFRRATS